MGKFDLLVIALIGILMLFGFGKGFVKQVLSTANWLIALILAFLFVKPVSGQMLTTALANNVNTKVTDWIGKNGEAFNAAFESANATEQLTDAISQLGLPKFIASIIAKGIPLGEIDPGTTLAQVLAPSISNIIVTIITFIGLFLIIFIALKILISLINGLFKGKVLGFVNRLLGAGLGFIKGGIIVCLIMLLASVLASVIPSINEMIANDFANSSLGIGEYFYENNPLIKIIEGSFSFDNIF